MFAIPGLRPQLDNISVIVFCWAHAYKTYKPHAHIVTHRCVFSQKYKSDFPCKTNKSFASVVKDEKSK